MVRKTHFIKSIQNTDTVLFLKRTSKILITNNGTLSRANLLSKILWLTLSKALLMSKKHEYTDVLSDTYLLLHSFKRQVAKTVEQLGLYPKSRHMSYEQAHFNYRDPAYFVN